MKKSILFIFCFLSSISCSDKKVFSETKSGFPSNQWLKNDVKTFSFDVDEEQICDLSLKIRHVYDYQFEKIPLLVTIKNPDGSLEQIPVSLEIKNEDGKDKGDCIGDLCDLEQVFLTNKKLAKGTYEISVHHNFNFEYVPNISSLGLEIKKSE